MKPYRLMSWLVLSNMGALAACGGTSTIGSGTEPKTGDGGSKADGTSGASTGMGNSASTGAKAGTGTGNTGSGASSGMANGNPGTGNTGTGASTGMGAAPGNGACLSDGDCTTEQSCEKCESDGGLHCTTEACVGGTCLTYDLASCATKCSDDKDCSMLDKGCIDCGNGSQACQISKCLMGSCQTTFQNCQPLDECAKAACGTPCKSCTTGTCDPKEPGVCNVDGKCTQGEPRCTEECSTAMDCGTTPPMCIDCGDGTCQSFQCVDKKCVLGCATEPPPTCKVNDDCPTLANCVECENSSAMCAVPACLQGSCQLVCPVQ